MKISAPRRSAGSRSKGFRRSCSTTVTAAISTRTARSNTPGRVEAHDSRGPEGPARARAGCGAPADRGHASEEGRVVGAAGHDVRRAGVVHRLLDVGRAPERALLRGALPLAVLLAVHLEVLRALHVRLRAARLHVPG